MKKSIIPDRALYIGCAVIVILVLSLAGYFVYQFNQGYHEADNATNSR